MIRARLQDTRAARRKSVRSQSLSETQFERERPRLLPPDPLSGGQNRLEESSSARMKERERERGDGERPSSFLDSSSRSHRAVSFHRGGLPLSRLRSRPTGSAGSHGSHRSYSGCHVRNNQSRLARLWSSTSKRERERERERKGERKNKRTYARYRMDDRAAFFLCCNGKAQVPGAFPSSRAREALSRNRARRARRGIAPPWKRDGSRNARACVGKKK